MAKDVSLDQQIACVEREVADRKLRYPLRVGAGTMPRQRAVDEIAAMQAVLDTLQNLKTIREERHAAYSRKRSA